MRVRRLLTKNNRIARLIRRIQRLLRIPSLDREHSENIELSIEDRIQSMVDHRDPAKYYECLRIYDTIFSPRLLANNGRILAAFYRLKLAPARTIVPPLKRDSMNDSL